MYYGNKWLILCTGLLWGIAIIAQVISPLIGKRIFDEALPLNNQRLVILLGIIWIGISWFSSTLRYFCYIFVTKVDTSAVKNTKLMVLRAFLNEFSRDENKIRKHGDRLSRILNDPQVFISSSGVGVILTTIAAIITFIVVLGLSIYLDWPLAIMCLVGTSTTVIIQYKTPQILAKSNQEVATIRANVTSAVENIIRAWRTIIRYRKIETEIDTAEKGLNDLVTTTRTARGKMYSAQLKSELLIKTMPILLIWIAAYRMSSGKMSMGTLIAFFSYLWMMSSSLSSILTSSFKAFSGFGQARDFMEIINNSIEQGDTVYELSDKSSLSTIAFEDIKLVAGDFHLRGENIKFDKGKTYLVTGDSGVGKSIFLEFLSGIKKAEHVRVLKNGKPCDNEYFMAEAREFGYLVKEEILFDRSVLDNMEYGDIHNNSGVKRYAKTLQMSNMLSRRTANLSAGEKQRVGFIRELTREPDLFIIDEGIDSLESDGKIKVLELIREVLPESILVICTHNWQSHIPIDETITISNGQITQKNIRHP